MGNEVTRRQMVTNILIGGVGAFGARSVRAGLAACGLTPPQGKGPFYPQQSMERDSDLTRLDPDSDLAKGQIIFIEGTVQNDLCQPIAGALVEIWQACATGKYNHSEDHHDLELDRDFQYWGQVRTDANGRYLLKTIVPGHYPNGGGTYRPPHVHFKVYAKKHTTLTTQMYFNPSSYDDAELASVVDHWNKYEGIDSRLIVAFAPGMEAGAKVGTFDITLQRN